MCQLKVEKQIASKHPNVRDPIERVGLKCRVLEAMFKRGQRLLIIKLEKCNEVRELLIENGTTGSWGHICYQDRDWRVSVTTVAVCIGVKEMGM